MHCNSASSTYNCGQFWTKYFIVMLNYLKKKLNHCYDIEFAYQHFIALNNIIMFIHVSHKSSADLVLLFIIC